MPRQDLTVQEVAERLGVGRSTANKYVQEGRFPNAYQVNPRLWLIPESDLEGFKRPEMGNPKRRKEQTVSNLYQIEVVHVLSEGEQVAYVITKAGGFIVGSIPDARHEDARQAGIIARNIGSLGDAEAWYKKNYGQSEAPQERER